MSTSVISSPSKRRIWVVVFVLLFTLGVNVPFWAACHFLHLLPIGWFSLEALLSGLAVLFVSRWLGALLLIAFFAEDLLCAIARTYYMTPWDVISHLGAATSFGLSRQILGVVLGLMAIAFFACLALFPITHIPRGEPRVLAALGILLFGLVGLGVDSLTIRRGMGRFARLDAWSRTGDENRFTHYRDLWVFRYATLRLRTTQVLFGYTPIPPTTHRFSAFPRMESATRKALSQLSLSHEHPSPNIVMIVVESWGLFNEARLQGLISQSHGEPDLNAKYTVESGSIPFAGSTVNGEVRELCGSTYGFEVERAPVQELANCLPDSLKALGYQTTAVHGMEGRLFLRTEWYKNMGFDDVWFRKRLLSAGLKECVAAFRGVCDASIASWITQRLQTSHEPQFTYWMTLNSHLPLPVPSGLANAANCADLPADRLTGPFCSWYQFMRNVHSSIAKMAATVTRPTVFIIAGDHAPPFSNMGVRAMFSQTRVPYLILMPRRG